MFERATHAARDLLAPIESARRRRSAGLVLELDLTEPLVEGSPTDPMVMLLARRRLPVRTVVETLRRAGDDPRVRALIAKVGGSRPPLTLARSQELREAIERFRSRGKPAVAWAETFGEAGRGSIPYHLATAFDEIWLQPSGDVSLTGVAAQVPFLRGALDRAGITPQLAQRHEYKSAANLFTEKGFTAAHREMTERLVHSLARQLVAGIAEGRRLDEPTVRALVDRAPLFASEARDAGLVDHLGYRDEAYGAVRERVGTDAPLQYLRHYARSTTRGWRERRARSRAPAVALVHVTGPIHLGRSGLAPLAERTSGSDSVNAALRAAVRDDQVKAIVLRVSSPGGSYVASDAIWRQVSVARDAGKPVVASLGEVAASGGYYVAMGADVIVAEPATITGSIGVVSGKQVVDGLTRRVGIAHETVAEGRHGLMFSPLQEFSDEEWERLNAWLDRVYQDFTTKVAAGRRLPAERVDDVARGRVWSGADARERGLVDELGGLAHATGVARNLAGLPPSAPVRAHPRVPVVARLRPPRSSEDPAATTAQIRMEAWGAFAGLATRAGLPAYGPLTLPGDWHLA